MSEFKKQMADKPTFSGLAEKFLKGEIKENICDLIDFCKELRHNPKWYATNSFNIKYKNKIIFRFHVFEDNRTHLYFTVANKGDLDGVLYGLEKDMQTFYFDNLRRCSHCNPTHGDGKRVTILSNDYWVCAEAEMFFENPTKEQIEYIKKFIYIRKENINKA